MNVVEKEFQIIKSPITARRLCHKGFYIIDIKKAKDKNDGSSVFVFKNTEEFRKALDEVHEGMPVTE